MDNRRTSEPVVNKPTDVSVQMLNTGGKTPGPGEYDVKQASVIGKDGPAYHMSSKSPARDLREGFPAPGDYKY